MPLEPSVTSASPGPWPCTLRYLSAVLPQTLERPSPKSVSAATNCSGVDFVVSLKWIVGMACSLLEVTWFGVASYRDFYPRGGRTMIKLDAGTRRMTSTQSHPGQQIGLTETLTTDLDKPGHSW